jgi:hypothetical protein
MSARRASPAAGPGAGGGRGGARRGGLLLRAAAAPPTRRGSSAAQVAPHAVLAPTSLLHLRAQGLYLRTSRELKRLDALVRRAPRVWF